MGAPARRLIVLGFVVLAGSCRSEQLDGAPCDGDGDCRSKKCDGGYCSGDHDCTISNGASQGCEPGWKCDEFGSSASAPAGALGGSNGGSRCVPLCGACPGNMYCPKAGRQGETTCEHGPAPLDVVVDGPTQARIGLRQHYVLRVSGSTAPIVDCTWTWHYGQEHTTTPEIDHVFDTPDVYAPVELHVAATDATGRRGDAVLDIVVACSLPGERCVAQQAGWCCQGQDVFCADDPFVCTKIDRPQVTVTGPATATAGENVTFTAKVTSSRPYQMAWQFDGQPAALPATETETYRFAAGHHVVQATAQLDRLSLTGSGTAEIDVAPASP